ncbi:AAA family ATPase [Pseudomonas sp. P66]|uniref:AAA family ATPase n=1 Tax=Pseudomonas arcuscaelestis TaxID=2710591 RepID=A0ABS2BV89_9PSED|nr:AAA family ATPase [Pseudomonas arcuscaelestis]MBM5457546.1 AAA family ATPase [Pseudomonas arcuscaelestis]
MSDLTPPDWEQIPVDAYTDMEAMQSDNGQHIDQVNDDPIAGSPPADSGRLPDDKPWTPEMLVAAAKANGLTPDKAQQKNKRTRTVPNRPYVPEFLEPIPEPALIAIALDDVMSASLEPVRFAVKPWLPRRHVTLFGGHGGIGKSSLALAIGAHVAAGRPFAGHDTERLPVLFVSLEDEPSIVRLRLRRIIEAFKLESDEVLPHMSLLDGTQAFSALMTEGDGFNAQPEFTRAFRELAECAQGAGLIIIDNASDAFDANENSRRAVRAFVRALATIARNHDAAVVLLAHIDKSAARNGSQGNSYSGSTAWHNSARSRLALTEQDGAIVLEHEKANLSTRADPLRLVFTDDVLMPEAGSDGAMLTTEHFDQTEIVRALRAAIEAGINVPASLTPGAHSAMKALEPLPEYGQTFRGSAGSKRAARALVALRRSGRVREENYRTPQRKDRVRLVLAEGSTQNDKQSASDEG